jgi:hypothetical protein
MSESDASHFLRMAIAFRVFEEPEPGKIGHNANSAAFVKAPQMQDWAGYCVEDLAPSALKAAEALQKWPDSTEPTQSGAALAFKGKQYSDVLKKDPARFARWQAGHEIFQKHPTMSPVHLVETLKWYGDKCPKTVVEVGGSNDHTMSELLRAFPNIRKGIVQGTQEVANTTEVPEGLKSRMSFESYDYFTMQRTRADAYIFRTTFHKYSDKYAMSILQNHIPALEPGARIILNEVVLGAPEEGNFMAERQVR